MFHLIRVLWFIKIIVWEINIDELKEEFFYVVQFTPMPYTLHNSIEVYFNTVIKGKCLCNDKYISPAQ